MQQWLLQSHFDDGPHWPRLIPRFCQSSWINQIEPGETQNQILSGQCQQWPSQSTLIYMDFTCEAAHGVCFTTLWQDMKTGCKISEIRLNHSHGCQSHAWCKIWNQCKHSSIPEGESWFWPQTDNAAVAPSKPFWRWPTLTKTEFHGFANHHESIKWNLEKHRIKILSGECQQWPSQSTLIYMDFTCEAAHGACFTTIWQDMKTGCKISETRLNHSHGCQSHAWCKIWNQCKHISIPEGESWFWPHTDNAAVAPSKPFWRWPTLTETESKVLPIIMNQSNGTWRNTESKFWVENANNGHHRAHWFTWISPVRQLTELVSRQFSKTWRQDAEFLKSGWIIPMGVRVMHDAKFSTNASTF